VNGGAGASFGMSRDTMDSQSVDIRKTTTSTLTVPGPGSDGVQHDEDIIYLLFGPKIDLAVSSSYSAWMLENSDQAPFPVSVGYLNGHTTIPTQVLKVLQNAGITEDDYKVILSHDPLWDGKTSPASIPTRFVFQKEFTYVPPPHQGDPNVPTTWGIIPIRLKQVARLLREGGGHGRRRPAWHQL